MNKVFGIVNMLRYAVRRFIHNPRVYIVVAVVYIFFLMVTDPIHKYVELTGEPVSTWLLPFILSDQTCVLIIYLLLILLFCDAPFIQQNEVYVFIRSGRKKWLLTQFLYICVMSATYVLFLNFATLSLTFMDAAYMPEWGKIFYSLANTNASEIVELPITISSSIIQAFSPRKALFTSTFFAWSVAVFLGSIMFVINLTFNRTSGTVVSALLVLTQYLTTNASGYGMTFFSPVSWVSLDLLDFSGVGRTPTPEYAGVVLWSIILLCWIISLLVIRKKDIDIYRTI